MAKFSWTTFVGGFLLGSAGLELLKTPEADKAFAYITAGVLVARDWVMEKAEIVNARALDVFSEAKILAENFEADRKLTAEECCVRGTDE